MKSAPTRSHRAIIGSSQSASVHDGPAAARASARFGVHTSRRTSLPRLTPRSLTGLAPPLLAVGVAEISGEIVGVGDSSSPPTATGRNPQQRQVGHDRDTTLDRRQRRRVLVVVGVDDHRPARRRRRRGGAAFHPAARARVDGESEQFPLGCEACDVPLLDVGDQQVDEELEGKECVLDE